MWTLCVGDVLAIVLLLAVLLFINVRVASFVFVVFWPLVCFVVVLSSLRVGVVLYVVLSSLHGSMQQMWQKQCSR